MGTLKDWLKDAAALVSLTSFGAVLCWWLAVFASAHQ